MKYVILKFGGVESAVLFPDTISHSVCVGDSTRIVSAGYCVREKGVISVWGKSDSLGFTSRSWDGEIIEFSLRQISRMLYAHETTGWHAGWRSITR